VHPILIDLGFYQLPSYGVMLAVSVLAALWTARRRADAAGMDGARVVDFGLWLVVWALVGAKLLLVAVEWRRYLDDPAQLIGLVRAGGVFLGGFIAAVVAAIVLLRRYGLPPLPTFDALAPSVALGQAIGRVGCLLAGCCWGRECTMPWAITYTDPAAAANLGTPLGVPLHPFPVYSSLFNLALFGLLAWLFARQPAPGRVFATYLVAYGTGRFALELYRGDVGRGLYFDGLLSTSQLIAIALVAIGAGLHWWIGRRRES
jgi:phosphatidylglycerol:prolipoprotein diacylglycerol transferase